MVAFANPAPEDFGSLRPALKPAPQRTDTEIAALVGKGVALISAAFNTYGSGELIEKSEWHDPVSTFSSMQVGCLKLFPDLITSAARYCERLYADIKDPSYEYVGERPDSMSLDVAKIAALLPSTGISELQIVHEIYSESIAALAKSGPREKAADHTHWMKSRRKFEPDVILETINLKLADWPVGERLKYIEAFSDHLAEAPADPTLIAMAVVAGVMVICASDWTQSDFKAAEDLLISSPHMLAGLFHSASSLNFAFHEAAPKSTALQNIQDCRGKHLEEIILGILSDRESWSAESLKKLYEHFGDISSFINMGYQPSTALRDTYEKSFFDLLAIHVPHSSALEESAVLLDSEKSQLLLIKQIQRPCTLPVLGSALECLTKETVDAHQDVIRAAYFTFEGGLKKSREVEPHVGPRHWAPSEIVELFIKSLNTIDLEIARSLSRKFKSTSDIDLKIICAQALLRANGEELRSGLRKNLRNHPDFLNYPTVQLLKGVARPEELRQITATVKKINLADFPEYGAAVCELCWDDMSEHAVGPMLEIAVQRFERPGDLTEHYKRNAIRQWLVENPNRRLLVDKLSQMLQAAIERVDEGCANIPDISDDWLKDYADFNLALALVLDLGEPALLQYVSDLRAYAPVTINDCLQFCFFLMKWEPDCPKPSQTAIDFIVREWSESKNPDDALLAVKTLGNLLPTD